MDIVTILILMALFYLVPELLKRGRPKTYEYPQIPDRVPPPDMAGPPAPVKAGPPMTIPVAAVTAPAAPPRPQDQPMEDQAAPSLDEFSPWLVRMDQTAVINGVVYAEILQPPRALRPLRPLFPNRR